ncbi:unnamed protein product [Caenorhabditis bovis]|uniref:Ketoreductase domain-containing protein n=1 Tax=Caenorhabditis bovis TaxID=2654633 RepID=A0A8S1EAT3_9PELO|nr:unnamed protein product [Caenorhabditis bovis]
MSTSYNFAGRRILVTGASHGIGRELCLKLAKCGAHVFAMARNEAALKSLEKASENMRHKITIVVGDVTASEENLRRLIFPCFPLHALVNNAGVAENAPVGQIAQSMFDRTFAVNVRAPIMIGQLVAKNFVDRQIAGTIVNISSVAGIRPLENHTVYCASKAALDMVTRTMAMELGSQNIRVNSVNPTVVMTDMGIANWKDPAKRRALLDKTPLNRFAEIDEVVNATLYLLSDASSMTTGTVLPVDGGCATI